MTQEEIDRMELVRVILSHLQMQLLTFLENGIPVESSFTLTNTGITEIDSDLQGFRRFVDLGGRSYTVSLNFPNTKTIMQARKKLKKDERKRNKKSS